MRIAKAWALHCGLLPLLAAATVAAAEPAPRAFEAHYLLERNGLLVARIKRQLRVRADGVFVFRSEARPAGIAAVLFGKVRITEQSLLAPHSGRLLPRYYSYRREGHRPRQRRAAFDWERGELILGVQGEQRLSLESEAPVFDRLSGELSVIGELRRAGERREWLYLLTEGKKVKEYIFRLQAKEWLDVKPWGRLQTLRVLRRQRHSEGKRKTLSWHAPQLDYLPVRTETTEKNGDLYVSTLETFRPAAGPDGGAGDAAPKNPANSVPAPGETDTRATPGRSADR